MKILSLSKPKEGSLGLGVRKVFLEEGTLELKREEGDRAGEEAAWEKMSMGPGV